MLHLPTFSVASGLTSIRFVDLRVTLPTLSRPSPKSTVLSLGRPSQSMVTTSLRAGRLMVSKPGRDDSSNLSSIERRVDEEIAVKVPLSLRPELMHYRSPWISSRLCRFTLPGRVASIRLYPANVLQDFSLSASLWSLISIKSEHSGRDSWKHIGVAHSISSVSVLTVLVQGKAGQQDA